MKYEAITIKDIAKALGLAASTVSRALKGSYEISAETRKLVNDYATKINYRPNPMALSLKERRTRTIGVVVSEIANTFFSQVINGIESIAYDRGYYVIITQTHESYSREILNIQHLASRSVDGLLVSLSTETEDLTLLHELHNKGLPIVLFDRVSDTLETHKIIADNFKGALEATLHLIQQGYKRIAHITSPPNMSTTKERLAGYREALSRSGISYNEDLVMYCDHGGHDQAEIELAMDKICRHQLKPDALLTASDRITIGAVTYLKKNEISIPSQMALVGFTNTTHATLFEPTLTAVTQPAFDMGRIATEKLLELIESKIEPTAFDTIIMDTILVTGKSSLKKPSKQKITSRQFP
jgi:LacI family transcriptional regulator